MKNKLSNPVFIVAIGIFVVLIIAGVILLKKPLSPPKDTQGIVYETTIAIDYSSPAVRDRKIWGGLLPYNVLWRAGANQATTFEFSKDVLISSNVIAAGKYSFFAIPREDEWTLILNSDWDQSGTTNYDQSKDVLRWDVKPKQSQEFSERLEYNILNDSGIELSWEELDVFIPISKPE
ncbi:MAG: DUF2911 domain-containing protein [Bacteroidota bacterium]